MQREYEVTISREFLSKAILIYVMSIALPCIILYFILHIAEPPAFHPWRCLLLCALCVLLHELLHALGFLAFGKTRSQISLSLRYFGCFSATPIKIEAYRTCILLPGVLLGLLPIIPVFIFGDLTLLIPVVFNLCYSVRDHLILWELRFFPSAAQVRDHPEEQGCLVYVEENE